MDALYIHIPFCDHICSYCDFAKEIASAEKKAHYMAMLKREILSHKGELFYVRSVFIGGGTPSLLSPAMLDNLKDALSEAGIHDLEDFSIEANPKDITPEIAKAFKAIGITRVSLGVQSFNPKHLKLLNRKHDEAIARSAVSALIDAGIENINADMLFGIPGQTALELREDLDKVTRLPLRHISYYSVIIEAKTPLEKWIRNGTIEAVDESLEGEMYDLVRSTLKAKGFRHYEISNFAKPGFESLHNTMVWRSEDYLGLGAGAHSKWRGERFYNVRSIKRYIERMEEDGSPIASHYPFEPVRDYLLMGLRLTEGVSLDAFEQRFGSSLFTHYPELREDLEKGLLEIRNGHLRFTERGLALGNTVFMKL